MDASALERFHQLIALRTGLALRDRDLESARAVLIARAKAQRLTLPEYLALLENAQSGAEWARLMPLLTNGESYFFRDPGQLALVREGLLPELIERANAVQSRTIRVWSAGCSNGEEAYSLAILIDELLPQPRRAREGWRVEIVGTDINPDAVERARRGSFGPWSLRTLDAAKRLQFFQESGGNYQIAPHLRDLVRFETANLCDGALATAPSFDLILCRNVLIYFARETVALALKKLVSNLGDGGFLITGHAELHHQDLGELRARLFAQSVVYQRVGDEPRASSTKPDFSFSLPKPASSTKQSSAISAPFNERQASSTKPINEVSTRINVSPSSTTSLEEFARTDNSLSSTKPVSTPARFVDEAQTEETVKTLMAQAQLHADAARYDEAATCCEAAMGLDGFAPEAPLLLARIAEERGDLERATTLFKKVIYLAPTQAIAYLELGALYERGGDVARGRQMRKTALELLQQSPQNARLEGVESLTAGELCALVREDLKAQR